MDCTPTSCLRDLDVIQMFLSVIPRKRESRRSLQEKQVAAAKAGWIPARAALGRNDGEWKLPHLGHSRESGNDGDGFVFAGVGVSAVCFSPYLVTNST